MSSYQRDLSRRVKAYRRSQAKARQERIKSAVERVKRGPLRRRDSQFAAASVLVPLNILDSAESMTPFMNALIDADNKALRAARDSYDPVEAEGHARWVEESLADVEYKERHPDPRCRYYPDLPTEMFSALELSRISAAWDRHTAGAWELTVAIRKAAAGDFSAMTQVLELLGEPEMARRVQWCIEWGWKRKYHPKPDGMPQWHRPIPAAAMFADEYSVPDLPGRTT